MTNKHYHASLRHQRNWEIWCSFKILPLRNIVDGKLTLFLTESEVVFSFLLFTLPSISNALCITLWELHASFNDVLGDVPSLTFNKMNYGCKETNFTSVLCQYGKHCSLVLYKALGKITVLQIFFLETQWFRNCQAKTVWNNPICK